MYEKLNEKNFSDTVNKLASNVASEESIKLFNESENLDPFILESQVSKTLAEKVIIQKIVIDEFVSNLIIEGVVFTPEGKEKFIEAMKNSLQFMYYAGCKSVNGAYINLHKKNFKGNKIRNRIEETLKNTEHQLKDKIIIHHDILKKLVLDFTQYIGKK